jgi:hypothetical protein
MSWEDIVVSSKILGHISSGVYRSAGGALKELVSNAFDANAARVVITTNHPSFDIITCRDNGDGMTLGQFRNLMKGGIGDSQKRTEEDKTPDSGRPIIGWLGIGMLGVAQICHEFTITSHHKETQTAFKATISLIDFLSEKVREIEPDELDEDLDVGKFSIEKIEFEASKRGTYIVASDMRSAFVRKFREFPGQPLPIKFSKFLNAIHNARSIKELGDYWQMVWELSISCPIPYIDGAFDWSKIKIDDAQNFLLAENQKLKDYKFDVVVDGLSLRKPVILPNPKETRDKKDLYGRAFSFQFDKLIYGQPLKLHGYIYLQDGRAIEPFEIRGVLIRIRNIAIGSYDPSFLQYPKIEGPRFNWLSGEIFIEEGLESALNIDRDSFNEIHDHYVKLQRLIHDLLPKVFYQASQGVRERSSEKQERKQFQQVSKMRSVLMNELGKEYIVEFEENETDKGPIELDNNKKKLVLYTNHPLWPRAKSKSEIAQLSLIAFEIAVSRPEEEQKEKFLDLLISLLDD